MASVTVVPNADGTVVGGSNWSIFGGPSSRYGAINNGTATQDDTDYIKNIINEGSGGDSAFFGFENMPEDFDEATSVTVKIRQLCYTNDDSVKYQLYQSNESTALTNEIELECDNNDIAHTHPHSFRTDTLNFSITGAITKTVWDGVVLKVIHVGTGDGDDPEWHVSEIDLVIGYTVATAPEIVMTGDGQNIADGDSSPRTADGTDFGTITAGGSTVTKTFTVTNDGDANLTTSTPTIPTGFTLTEGLDATIAAGANDTFSVRLDNSVVGTKSGDISIANNDADENPFNFAITGEVSAAAAAAAASSIVPVTNALLRPSFAGL
jgi:hypothetical protein